MTIVTFKPTAADLFTRFEIIFWGVFLGIPTALGIGAHLTPQDPPIPFVGWAILWAAIGGMYLVAVLFFVRRWKQLKTFRFRLDPIGLMVAWAEDKYCVSGEMVQREVDNAVLLLRLAYPNAAQALRGCVVVMMEPKFFCWPGPGFVARKVTGVQDGQLLYVGWREDLSTSALKHELAHRVLQVFGGDPEESAAHELMAKLGIG